MIALYSDMKILMDLILTCEKRPIQRQGAFGAATTSILYGIK